MVGKLVTGLFCLLLLAVFPALAEPKNDKPIFVFQRGEGPPFHQADGKGYIDLIVSTAFDRMGYDVRLEIVPSIRGFKNADDGTIDGHYSRSRNSFESFPNVIRVNYPLFQSRLVAVSIIENLNLSSPSKLKGLTMAYPRGWSTVAEKASYFLDAQPAADLDQLFHLLQNRRVNLVVHEESVVIRELKRRGLMDKAQMTPFLLADTFIGMASQHRHLVPRLETVLRDMEQDGTIKDLCPVCIGARNLQSREAKQPLFPIN